MILVAEDTAAARDLRRERRPHAVVLDWMLPKGGGASVLAELRRLQRDTPVVVISAVDAAKQGARGSGAARSSAGR